MMTIDSALAIVEGAREAASANGFKPLALVVLDAGGHVVAAQREDGAANKRFEIAYGKAYGAISLGVDSRALMDRAEQQPYFIAGAASAIGGHLIAVPGGVLIHGLGGELVGAVGVSGDTSDNDEAAAIAGIRSAGWQTGNV